MAAPKASRSSRLNPEAPEFTPNNSPIGPTHPGTDLGGTFYFYGSSTHPYLETGYTFPGTKQETAHAFKKLNDYWNEYDHNFAVAIILRYWLAVGKLLSLPCIVRDVLDRFGSVWNGELALQCRGLFNKLASFTTLSEDALDFLMGTQSADMASSPNQGKLDELLGMLEHDKPAALRALRAHNHSNITSSASKTKSYI